MGKLLLAAMTLTCVACGGHGAASPTPPALVNVEFRTALIAPTKSGGATWDAGPSTVDPGPGFRAAAQLLSIASTYAAAASAVVSVSHGVELPEPAGTATVMVAGVATQQVELRSESRDTLTPAWVTATATRVPLAPGTAIEVRLRDEDLVADDSIGDCGITYRDLVDALSEEGKVHQVHVADQTMNQLLYMGITVYPAS